MKVVIVSGYFDPLHVGHLEMICLAKKLGDELVVIVNNDKQAKIKKGKSFMKEGDRLEIIKSIKYVDLAVLSLDNNKTVCRSLEHIRDYYPDCEIIFANGGDANNEDIPEAKTAKKCDIRLVDGLGKKIRSSSKFTGIK